MRLIGLIWLSMTILIATWVGAAPWHNDEIDPVWQWSIPAPSIPERRAFLWIPPACPHVRGIVVALQNMLEKPLFERRSFRSACAANDMAIMMIFSGHDRAPGDDKSPDHPPRSYLDLFLNPDYPKGPENPADAGEDLQKLLDTFAEQSGYPELSQAPLLPVGHSSAGSFVWHLYRWNPSRIFAMMPFKTGMKNDGPSGIPIFNVESEWFDYGGNTSNVSSKLSDIQHQESIRDANPDELFSFYIDIGAGHCDVSDDSIEYISLFLKKVVAARIPRDTPAGQPVQLNPIDVKTGWLIAPADLGKSSIEPVAYADWKGDPKQAFWYLDQELANAVQKHMIAQKAKKSQQMNFVKADGSVPTTGGTFIFAPKFIDDQGTFKLEAKYIDQLQGSNLYPPGTKLENGGDPILYRVNSGAVRQVGPDTFRIIPHAGPIGPQGNPWEPTLVAYTLGNDQFRPIERPAHAQVNIINKDGVPQTIDFPTISNHFANDPTPIRLTASASSKLPVEYYVISGPIRLADDGTSLQPTDVPVKMKTPARVLVAAFQWGRPVEPKIQSAGPVIQQFWMTRNGDVIPTNQTESPAPPASR